MPANNPLAYLIPQLAAPPIGAPMAPAAAMDLNILASLAGVQPTAMSAGASDIVRRGMAPMQTAAPPQGTPAGRAPALQNMGWAERVQAINWQRMTDQQLKQASGMGNNLMFNAARAEAERRGIRLRDIK